MRRAAGGENPYEQKIIDLHNSNTAIHRDSFLKVQTALSNGSEIMPERDGGVISQQYFQCLKAVADSQLDEVTKKSAFEAVQKGFDFLEKQQPITNPRIGLEALKTILSDDKFPPSLSIKMADAVNKTYSAGMLAVNISELYKGVQGSMVKGGVENPNQAVLASVPQFQLLQAAKVLKDNPSFAPMFKPFYDAVGADNAYLQSPLESFNFTDPTSKPISDRQAWNEVMDAYKAATISRAQEAKRVDKQDVVTKEQVESINAVDKSVKENANPQENKKSYDEIGAALAKYQAGQLTLEELLKAIDGVGGVNKDVAVQSYLACIRAALTNPSLKGDQQKDALSVINGAFAYLGDESKTHDLESALLAAQSVIESDKIPQDAKAQMQKDIGNIDVEIDDNSPQQAQAEEQSDKQEVENVAAKKKEEDAKYPKEKTHKVSTAKQVIKYSVALGVAFGCPPPFGIPVALAFLYMARSVGERKKQEEVAAEEFAKDKAMLGAGQSFVDGLKAEKLAQGAANLPDDEELQPADPTKTKAAIDKVAQDSKSDVEQSQSALQQQQMQGQDGDERGDKGDALREEGELPVQEQQEGSPSVTAPLPDLEGLGGGGSSDAQNLARRVVQEADAADIEHEKDPTKSQKRKDNKSQVTAM